MYTELDRLLLKETTIDSWYDDGFVIAQDILKQFDSEDWKKLNNELLNKDLDWHKKLIYCIHNQIIDKELEIILRLITIDDKELFEMCIDALRVFNNETGYSLIKKNPQIIAEVKERINVTGNVGKKILQDFLEKFKTV